MPPSAVKKIRDLIYWQYAKIVSQSAGIGKKNYGFVMNRFKKFQNEEIFWNEIREYVKEIKEDKCIYCGSGGNLTLDHIFPRSLGGPDTEKNVVRVCKQCNLRKGSKRLYEFYAIESGLNKAKYDVPRIAEGKYLKFLFELFKIHDLLDFDAATLKEKICAKCDLKKLCKKEDSIYKLSPLCLDSLATICLASC